jgi:hypothetical protein
VAVLGVWPAAISRKEETRASFSAAVGGTPAMAGGGVAGPCCCLCLVGECVSGGVWWDWWGRSGSEAMADGKWKGNVRGEEEEGEQVGVGPGRLV